MFTIVKSTENNHHLELELKYSNSDGKDVSDYFIEFKCEYIESIDIHFYYYEQHSASSTPDTFPSDFKRFSRNTLQNDLEKEKENFFIKLFFNKVRCKTLAILSERDFLKSVPKESKKKMNFWNKNFTNFDSIFHLNSKVEISLKKTGPVSIEGVYNNNGVFISPMSFKPEDCWEILNELDNKSAIYNHFSGLILIYCLYLLSNDVKIEKPEIKEDHGEPIEPKETFIFEGFGRSELLISEEIKNPQEFLDVVFTSYQWAFSDHHVSTKLGILRNVVSINSEVKVEKIFARSFLKILFSNYQIYLRDNIHKYIEVKNKAIEIINNLNDKIIENYYSFRKTARTSTYAVLTFYFTFIITKVFSSDTPSLIIIDFEVFFITCVFCITAIIFIHRQFKELNQYYNFSKERVKKIKNQYEGTLSDREREEVFSDALLLKHKEIDSNYDELIWHYGILASLIVVTFIAALYNSWQ